MLPNAFHVVDAASGMETASHAGHCPINLVNVRYIETKLYREQDKSDEKISQKVQ